MTTSALFQAKQALRKELKLKLAAMTDAERLRQSDIIVKKLFKMPEYQTCKRVSLYLHMKEEVYTTDILKNLLQSDKKCFIPHYVGPAMTMVQLTSWQDYEALPENKWKIKQPADNDTRPDALETGGLDLIMMPGLGFTIHGDRIGRGKGYYDAYLKQCINAGCRATTIALAYKEQICDYIPCTENDMKVDIVLTLDL